MIVQDLRACPEAIRTEKTIVPVIQVIESLIAARDPYTSLHQQNVAEVAITIAKQMELPPDRIFTLRMAASIHDIGKIAIPAEILSKPGKLLDLEYAMIQQHPEIGYAIVSPLKLPRQMDTIMLQHHERINGSGYPYGTKGEQILLEARILGVADVLESMCSHRPYRPALGIESACEELKKNRGVLYDAEVVDACLKACDNGLGDWGAFTESIKPYHLGDKAFFTGRFSEAWAADFNCDRCFSC